MGPIYMRAYQALTSLTQKNFFTVIGLDGELKHLQMTKNLVQEALNLPSSESIDFFKLEIQMKIIRYVQTPTNQCGMN